MADSDCFIVPHGPKKRIDLLLAQQFKQISRSRIQEAIRGGYISCQGHLIDPKTCLEPGLAVEITWPPEKKTTLTARQAPLSILYEDEDLLVVNKDPGDVVHPGAGTKDTLVEAVLHHTSGKLATAAGENRPGVVHRLDRETSGAIIFAKTDTAYWSLTKLFSQRVIYKVYEALIKGSPALLSGRITGPIARHPTRRTHMCIHPSGRPAISDWVLENHLLFSTALLKVRIHSGRTHQIRVHLSSLNWPILGDCDYGFQPSMLPQISVPRVMLHARTLRFPHPISGQELKIDAPNKEDMASLIQKLSVNN